MSSSENTEFSSSPAALRLHWDVFLSFRGEDTRHNLTETLYESLTESGVRVFKDDVGMSQGDEIAPTLLEAIEDSAASVVVLSPRYANSHLCLNELAKICKLGRRVLPVFFRVDPSDVRRQKGPFEEDFGRHLERFGVEKVEMWRSAMKKVGGISGWVFKESAEKQLVLQLINRLSTELRKTPVGLATYTVGLDSRVEKLVRLLDVKSNRVQVLGLHGMGGIGKTTLAKALYNKLIGQFEYRCFLSDVRENSGKGDVLKSLQRKLLRDLSRNEVPPVDLVDAGITKIKQMVYEKRVLIVLDDVDDESQVNALAGQRDWFHEGSRIVITTRNKEVLVEHLVNEWYEVRELYEDEALQLFSYHALRREKPTDDDHLSLSKQIVDLTGRLPLALEVFGSFLFHKRRLEEWKDALERLQQIRPQELQNVLTISFEALDADYQCVFLDIACLFVKIGMKREEAIDVLKGCGFRAETAITVLTERSLIKIREDYTLWMHDQLRDMGRQIVLQENIVDPGMRSRLWDQDEIMNVLKLNKGTMHVRGIILDLNLVEYPSAEAISSLTWLKEKCKKCFPFKAEKGREIILSTKSFKSMVNLRLLHISRAKLKGKFKSFPAELKWLQWKECPLEHLPSDYDPWQLAVLDLSQSGIRRVWGWGSNKVAENLTVMNLHRCYNLVELPDLVGYKKLEKLELTGCRQLTIIHKSVGSLETLLYLNLEECENLVEFPSDVSGLKLLQKLILSDCAKLKELPEDIGSMCSLKELLVDKTAISKLPASIFRLTKLEKLSLQGSRNIKQLPDLLGNLNSLKELFLDRSAIEELPATVESLSNLEILSLMSCKSLTKIPESVGNLHSLRQILVYRSGIKELPASIGRLCYLKKLSAGQCFALSKLPDSIGGLASLTELDLDGTSITDLPDQIRDLKMIDKLCMKGCVSLGSLPVAIGCMLTLTTLNLLGSNITELPDSIGKLSSLVELRLTDCGKLCRLPDSIGNLKSLHHLLMERTGVTELPESFGMLSCLMTLRMGKKPLKSEGAEDKSIVLPTSFSNLCLLEELDARAWRISGRISDDFENLSSLVVLNLGYNNFYSLSSSLRGLSLLRKLFLPHCKQLKSLPPLPSSLVEIDAANCVALESISDVSNLESLQLLNLTNCEKLADIPGLECLKSLKRLYMSDCRAYVSTIKTRLSKACLRNILNLSIPGSEIPSWFSGEVVTFSERRHCKIKAVIIGCVVSLKHQEPCNLRDDIPAIPDIQAKIVHFDKSIFSTTLKLFGVPNSDEDQIHLCRYNNPHALVGMLRDGCKIVVSKRNPPITRGVELKKCGIHLVYEKDDDYQGNEELLDESQQSVSEKLARFFNSIAER